MRGMWSKCRLQTPKICVASRQGKASRGDEARRALLGVKHAEITGI